MKMKERDQQACTTPALNREGQANLCCCYVMDFRGKFHDPCFSPVDACCLTFPTAEDQETGTDDAGLK